MIPYTFVYSPAMLGVGAPLELLQASITCLISAYGLSMGLIGVGIAPMKRMERMMYPDACIRLQGAALFCGYFTHILTFLTHCVDAKR